MNTNADVVVVTPHSPTSKLSPRVPFARLILPLSIMQGEIFFPRGLVWWIEQNKNHAWLRGRGEVESALVEESLQGSARQLVWELSTQTAERISLPGTLNRNAEVSALLSGVVKNQGIQIFPVSPALSSALDDRCENVSEVAWSFDHAGRHTLRLTEQLHLLEHLPRLNGKPDEAWYFARSHFSRAELVTLSGWDAFHVAAAALSGLPEMPKDWHSAFSSITDDKVMHFYALDVEHIARIERAWERNANVPLPLDALEQSDKRHQQILKSLAMSLKLAGFSPTYNRFVDMRVVGPRREIFFEIKTTRPENFLHQVRLAVGQLLEYRFRRPKHNDDHSPELVAVVEQNALSEDIEFARHFLASLDISLVLWKSSNDEFESLYSIIFSNSSRNSSVRHTAATASKSCT